MGVSTYTMKEKLPDDFRNILPTKEELELKLRGGFNV